MEDFKDIEYFEAKTQGGRIILEPVRISSLSDSVLENVRKKIAALGLSEKDIEDAIAWARKD
jgi:hypothetical protein